MKVWYDTEFHERGHNYPIDLISIGLVREDGAELYRINSDMDFDAAWANEWLRANVMRQLPLLPETPDSLDGLDLRNPSVCPRAAIRRDVAEFLDVKNLELWAWYGAYDHVVLAQLFGRMIDLPPHIPMWTNDLRQEVHRLGVGPLPEQPAGLHNALADARHLGRRHRFVESHVRSDYCAK